MSSRVSHFCIFLIAVIMFGNSWGSLAVFDVNSAITENEHTVVLQAFLDRPEDTLVIPDRGGDYVVGPLFIRNDRKHIVLEPGVVLRGGSGLFPELGDCLISMVNRTDISLVGYGSRLVMPGKEFKEGEWRHAIKISGSRRILIEGVSVDSSGGDGIYVGSYFKAGIAASEDIVIRNSKLWGHRRQGISIISARRLLIEGVWSGGTKGTAPESGLDFEPNRPDEFLEDCIVRHSVFWGNNSHSAMVYLVPFNSASAPVSIRFEYVIFAESNKAGGLYVVGMRKNRGLRGKVEVVSSVFIDNELFGVGVFDNPERKFTVTVDSSWIIHGVSRRGPSRRYANSSFAAGWGRSQWDTVGGLYVRNTWLTLGSRAGVFSAWPKRKGPYQDVSMHVYLSSEKASVLSSYPYSDAYHKEPLQGTSISFGGREPLPLFLRDLFVAFKEKPIKSFFLDSLMRDGKP